MIRATYQDIVMMGVGINNIEKIVRTVLTNLPIWTQSAFQKQRWQDLCTQNQEDLVNAT